MGPVHSNQPPFNLDQYNLSSAFIKHISNTHGGIQEGKSFEDYFDFFIVKSYKKPLSRCVEEGTFIVNF